jgi:hypothetical protein
MLPKSISETTNNPAKTMFDHRFDVVRFYCDPFWWESTVAGWEAHWPRRAAAWRTNRPRAMAEAVAAYATAIRTGELAHDGNPGLVAHVGNARRRDTNLRDDQGARLFTIAKERPDSPHKIDLCMASILSWEARKDALATPPVVPKAGPFSVGCACANSSGLGSPSTGPTATNPYTCPGEHWQLFCAV